MIVEQLPVTGDRLINRVRVVSRQVVVVVADRIGIMDLVIVVPVEIIRHPVPNRLVVVLRVGTGIGEHALAPRPAGWGVPGTGVTVCLILIILTRRRAGRVRRQHVGRVEELVSVG